MMHDHDFDWLAGEMRLEDVLEDVGDILATGDVHLARQELHEAPMEARVELAFAIHGEVLSLLDAGLNDRAAERLAIFNQPKFGSLAACEEAYAKAMGARS